MNLENMRQKLKQKSGGRAGMILIHNGVVRNTTRNGLPVSSIEVDVDYEKLVDIMKEAHELPGVMAVDVEIAEGPLKIGDDIMLLGVAGDLRENTISALKHVLDRIKAEVTSKKEFS